jgi:hypothetical protein
MSFELVSARRDGGLTPEIVAQYPLIVLHMNDEMHPATFVEGHMLHLMGTEQIAGVPLFFYHNPLKFKHDLQAVKEMIAQKNCRILVLMDVNFKKLFIPSMQSSSGPEIIEEAMERYKTDYGGIDLAREVFEMEIPGLELDFITNYPSHISGYCSRVLGTVNVTRPQIEQVLGGPLREVIDATSEKEFAALILDFYKRGQEA